MTARRFLLRLTTGLLCFALGWASALLLGATGASSLRATRRHELVVPHFDVPPAGPSCRAKTRARHTHEWDGVSRAEEFELRFEVPPPPTPRR